MVLIERQSNFKETTVTVITGVLLGLAHGRVFSGSITPAPSVNRLRLRLRLGAAACLLCGFLRFLASLLGRIVLLLVRCCRYLLRITSTLSWSVQLALAQKIERSLFHALLDGIPHRWLLCICQSHRHGGILLIGSGVGIVRAGLGLRRLLLLLFRVEGDILVGERIVDCVIKVNASGVDFPTERLESFMVCNFLFAALETLEVFGC